MLTKLSLTSLGSVLVTLKIKQTATPKRRGFFCVCLRYA